MSDIDPVFLDILQAECTCCAEPTIDATDVPKLVANELRRIYEEHGDPALYFLVIRAQELEIV